MAENELEIPLILRFWNCSVEFVDEQLKQSAKTATTLLIFVGLSDASIDNFRRLCTRPTLCCNLYEDDEVIGESGPAMRVDVGTE